MKSVVKRRGPARGPKETRALGVIDDSFLWWD